YRFAGSADDAQDLTQEVFIKIYRTLNSYDLGRGAFMTWVTSITRNLLVDHFRKSKQDRLTDSLDAGASEHEEAQPLSEQIQDKAAPPDASVQPSRGCAGGVGWEASRGRPQRGGVGGLCWPKARTRTIGWTRSKKPIHRLSWSPTSVSRPRGGKARARGKRAFPGTKRRQD